MFITHAADLFLFDLFLFSSQGHSLVFCLTYQQTTWPHMQQWCCRTIMLNPVPHVGQASISFIDCHDAGGSRSDTRSVYLKQNKTRRHERAREGEERKRYHRGND